MTGFVLVIIRTQCWGLFKRLYLPEKYLNKTDFILSIYLKIVQSFASSMLEADTYLITE